MKFGLTKIDGLDGLTKVRIRFVDQDDFVIQADKRLVELKGTLEITSMEELQSFAEALSKAWAEHTKLKPKLTTTMSGH